MGGQRGRGSRRATAAADYRALLTVVRNNAER